MILGALARVTDDPEECRRCLEEGQQILEAGSPAHNQLFFYREAIEVSLQARDWPGALRYADVLEREFRTEPLLFADFMVGRARALAATGQGRRDPVLRSQLQRLLATATKSRYALLVPALEAAVAAPGWEPDEPSA